MFRAFGLASGRTVCRHLATSARRPFCDTMCLIIKKPAGRTIAAEFLHNAWQDNPHGWGCFHLVQGRPVWARGMSLAGLVEHNRSLPGHAEVYLHLRKATYGPVSPSLAHPHMVREGLLLMHNGSIDHLAPADTAISGPSSDTTELAACLRDVLAGLSDAQAARMLRSDGLARLLAPLIHGSMLVLLDAHGAVRLGRDWLSIGPAHWWDAAMAGIEVSNTHTWRWHAQASATMA